MKKLLLLFLILIVNLSYVCCQSLTSSDFFYEWESDSTIQLKSKGINFKSPFLVDLTFESKGLNSRKADLLFRKDSIMIKKGIFQTKHVITLPAYLLNDTASSLPIIIKLETTKSQKLIVSKEIELIKPRRKLPNFSFNDSTLIFNYESSEKFKTVIKSYIKDRLTEKQEFILFRDTSIKSRQIINQAPLDNRSIIVSITDKKNILYEDSLLYQMGRFIPIDRIPDSAEADKKEEEKAISLSGSFYVENNYFSQTPQHSNNLQYPNTLFRLSNTVKIYGIPFRMDAHHTTNDNIDPNFRNFFSFSLDVDQYRNQIKDELISKQLASEYTLPEINQDLESNLRSQKKLEQLKSTLKQYPDQKINVDSILLKEANQLKQFESLDTSKLNTALDTNFLPPTDLSYEQNINEQDLKKIDKYINRLEKSKRYKEQLKQQKIDFPTELNTSTFNKKELFENFENQNVESILLRFEKLELGNFYELAGKYSIRDVEMKGLNTSFLLNSTNEIGLLRGKVNNFQSFNLDNIQEDITLSSVALTNTDYELFSPTFRLTQAEDGSVNPEFNLVSSTNYVASILAQGEISSFLFYEGEINRSTNTVEKTLTNENDLSKSLAYYGRVEVQPVDFLGINATYDRVGSNYQSEGVYFLVRDLRSYSIGSHLKLFKNKIYFKNDYTIIDRNFENEELTNRSRKLFFDLGSRFKRIPNFQLIHTPITVDIANKLDTSFSNLDAFSSITIARVFYIKKVRRTVYNTALIYNKIVNDYFDGTNKQTGFQHFIAFSNPKTQFTFTSSYSEIFEKVRFISSSLAHKLNDNWLGSLYLAKNFLQDRYSTIVRLKLDAKVRKNLLLGAGGMLLVEPSAKNNLGSTVSLKYVY